MKVVFPKEDFAPFLGHVYEPAEDSYLLVDAIAEDLDYIKNVVQPKIFLEIGSGSGIVTTSLYKSLNNESREFFATDCNTHAIRATNLCLKLHNVDKVQVIHTNLADGVKDQLRKKVDILVSNPPFEPTPEGQVDNNSVKKAWSAGSVGRMVIDLIIPELPELMSQKGHVYMVMCADNDIQDVMNRMKDVGFGNHKIIKEKFGTTSSTHNRIYQQYVIRFSR